MQHNKGTSAMPVELYPHRYVIDPLKRSKAKESHRQGRIKIMGNNSITIKVSIKSLWKNKLFFRNRYVNARSPSSDRYWSREDFRMEKKTIFRSQQSPLWLSRNTPSYIYFYISFNALLTPYLLKYKLTLNCLIKLNNWVQSFTII